MNKGVLSLAALLSCTSQNADTAVLHPQVEYSPEIVETGDLHYAGSFPASRVDMAAYYFFVDDNCLPELEEALSAAAAYRLVSTVYVPSFFVDSNTRIFDNLPLPKKEWGTIYIGLNDVVFQQDTLEKALFFDPMGDATGHRELQGINDYAVVAQESLYGPFQEFVASREVLPEINLYTCSPNATQKE